MQYVFFCVYASFVCCKINIYSLINYLIIVAIKTDWLHEVCYTVSRNNLALVAITTKQLIKLYRLILHKETRTICTYIAAIAMSVFLRVYDRAIQPADNVR